MYNLPYKKFKVFGTIVLITFVFPYDYVIMLHKFGIICNTLPNFHMDTIKNFESLVTWWMPKHKREKCTADVVTLL